MFKENFINLCTNAGVSPSQVCKSIGLSNAAYSQWNEKTVPRATTLKKLADYFGITPNELLGKENADKQNSIPLSNLIENTIDIELTSEIAKLIKTDDNWTKQLIINLLRVPPQNREIFKSVLANITEG